MNANLAVHLAHYNSKIKWHSQDIWDFRSVLHGT